MASTAAPPDQSTGSPDTTPGDGAAPTSVPGGGSGRVRVAVVGAGYIAEYHLDVLRRTPEVELVAVCDLDLERAREAAREYGAPSAVASLDELAGLGVQVAHVLVPPDHHAATARRLLEADVGVFLEKPFALNRDDARALVELAEERGLPLGVNHNNCFHPAFVRLTEELRAGTIGRLEHVQVTLSVPLRQLDANDFSHWMFREPRNIVFEQAPHPFSQLYELVGPLEEMQVSILGSRELHPGQVFHDRWSLSARAERGTAQVYLAFGQDFTRSSIQVLGTDGMLEADLHHDLFARETKSYWLDFWNSFLAGWRRGGALRRGALRGLWYYGRQTLGLGDRQDAFYVGMRGSIRAFHRDLARGRRPRIDGRHGLGVIEWCEAATAGVTAPAEPPALPAESPEPRPGEVCVIGCTGFIGRATLRALAERDAPVTSVVRRRHSLPAEVVEPVLEGRMRLASASLGDAAALEEATRGARVVLHLATGGGDDWDAIQRNMVQGTIRVAEACLANGVERLVYVSSTAALYLGHDCGSDVLDDDVGPDPRPEGRALYARGKIAAEEALRRLVAERGLPLTVVRPAVVVGKGAALQHSGLGLWVRDNHCVGWGLGRRPSPLVLVEDVADALARLALHEGTELDGKALNLAARVPLTPAQTVAAFRRVTGRDFHFHPRRLWFSQALELGKWVVKRVGGRRVPAPDYRDLKSREMYPELTCNRARDVLGWRPCEDPRELFSRWLG